jgi:hypothetical protein
MPRAKKNYARGSIAAIGSSPDFPIDDSLDLTAAEIKKGKQKYRKWHWGHEARQAVDWNDPDMPRMLIECGRLVRMHARLPRNIAGLAHPRRRRDTMIEFSRNVSPAAHIAYDPSHPHERLYLLIPQSQQGTIKQRFWDRIPDDQIRDLNDWATIAGGRHARKRDYPHIRVKPIGILTGVVYYTAKKGDAPRHSGSFYIHHVGELSAVYPILCVDQQGRLWLAGGNYTSPPPGITD